MNEISIPSVPLSASELEEHYAIIAEVRPVILKWCQRIYGENRYKQFRLDYFSGELEKHRIGKKDRAQLERLQAVENSLLQHNVRLCIKLSRWYYRRSRHRMPGVQLNDFFQEAALSVCDSVWSYDGSTKFVTYIHWAICNRIKDFIRVDSPLSPPSPDILELGNSVYDYMGKHGCNLETALIALKIPKEQHDNVRAISASVISQEAIESESNAGPFAQRRSSLAEYVEDHREQVPEDYDPMMMVALETAGLNELEREVFDAYLLNEKRYQTRIADDRGVTRQAISYAFKQAKAKVQARYFELCPSENPEPEPEDSTAKKREAA